MKGFACAVGASLVLTSVAMGAGSASAHEPRESSRAVCSGTLAAPGVLAGNYGNVVIEGVCAVNGGAAVVNGNLTLAPGSALNATFALNDVAGKGTSSLTVRGNLKVEDGAVLAMGCEANHSPCSDDPAAATGGTLTGDNHVVGNLKAYQALAVIVHASRIGGNVEQRDGGGGLSCAVPTSGIFSELGSPVFSDYEDNRLGGNLSVTGLRTCWYGALRNDVRGNFTSSGNIMADPDGDEVHSNTVAGNLRCFDNSPAVQYGDAVNGVPNTVSGVAKGECRFGLLLPNPVAAPPAPAGPLTPISVMG